MTTLRSHVRPDTDEFRVNAAAMEHLVSELNGRLERTRLGGTEEHRERHQKRGKLQVRERIRLLCDPDGRAQDFRMRGRGGRGDAGVARLTWKWQALSWSHEPDGRGACHPCRV